MKKVFISITLFILAVIAAIIFLMPKQKDQSNVDKLREKYSAKTRSSADHSKFEALKKDFNTPQEVTAACNTCHTERHKEIMNSSHWNWERQEYVKGRGIISIGKKNAVNNFCIGVDGNEQSCAKCHIGFGMTDKTFTFTDENNVDCLVCHDNSETYAKGNEMSGYPDPKLHLSRIAQQVGKPKRSNCGVCHFFGGGGNNVKHGDLEKAMFEPNKSVDVHMATDGKNLQCVDCHLTEKHNITGKVYSLSSMNRNRSTCEQCHTESPHESSLLNEHTVKVSCQTCHIPVYAKVNATKTEWDWSTAGKLKDGLPYEEDDEDGNHTYLSIKGSFKWGKNLKPEYIWFNGNAQHYLLGDTIKDTSVPLVLNKLLGSYNDRDSKITPVKIHRARQPYDPVNKMLIQPKLFSSKTGEGALWKDFDWHRAAEVGMKEVDLPFSGKIEFINTEMYWPINHMVSPKDSTLKCTECHTRTGGRIANLKDFYIPGRDFNKFVDYTGAGIIIATFIGIAIHGSLRFKSSKKRNKNK
ncbi:MAG: tetrathionate reductase family octaheme c-type cytochrome [Ignavibacteria bacterium]|jgi:octaheme c-type cytochrome (tetrathionate reductase family)|nr:tetrathionate reductase family octaheme c-type cytochrome [Ignavibacteria bacterium]